MMINLTDNNIGNPEGNIFKRKDISELFSIANINIKDLCKENDHLLVFPYSIGISKDLTGTSSILKIENTNDSENVRIITGNIVGFIGINDCKIKIKSRFDKGRDDYFLHYMLQKVLSFNLFDLNHNSDEEDVFDFIMFMFPTFLKSAMRQGLYREYKKEEHHDAKVKGVIDINQFIHRDIPFAGRIAYSVRNYNQDNDMLQLIRHTIEYMKVRKYGQNILNIDKETIENTRIITENTPSYNKNERNHIIRQNLKPKVHPYYTEYQPLQNLCIQILRMEEVKYGNLENEICGILFDAAWLWEEYVNTILQGKGFIHAENKNNKNGFYLFEDLREDGKIHRSGIRYPDFYKGDLILDAKYKKLGSYNHVSKVDRNDIHQLITYMTRLHIAQGGFVAPLENRQDKVPTSHIKDSDSTLSIYGIEIDQNATSYQDFKNHMAVFEKQFIESFKL